MKIKHLKEKTIITVILLIGIVILGISGIGCIFNTYLGIRCPGCGMTRAVVSALRLDFYRAFYYHKMFWSLPILYAYFLFDGRIFKRKIIDILILSAIAVGFCVNWLFYE